MSEQSDVPQKAGTDAEQPTPGAGRPGDVRTQGETAVDEAMGSGDNVH